MPMYDISLSCIFLSKLRINFTTLLPIREHYTGVSAPQLSQGSGDVHIYTSLTYKQPLSARRSCSVLVPLVPAGRSARLGDGGAARYVTPATSGR